MHCIFSWELGFRIGPDNLFCVASSNYVIRLLPFPLHRLFQSSHPGKNHSLAIRNLIYIEYIDLVTAVTNDLIASFVGTEEFFNICLQDRFPFLKEIMYPSTVRLCHTWPGGVQRNNTHFYIKFILIKGRLLLGTGLSYLPPRNCHPLEGPAYDSQHGERAPPRRQRQRAPHSRSETNQS